MSGALHEDRSRFGDDAILNRPKQGGCLLRGQVGIDPLDHRNAIGVGLQCQLGEPPVAHAFGQDDLGVLGPRY